MPVHMLVLALVYSRRVARIRKRRPLHHPRLFIRIVIWHHIMHRTALIYQHYITLRPRVTVDIHTCANTSDQFREANPSGHKRCLADKWIQADTNGHTRSLSEAFLDNQVECQVAVDGWLRVCVCMCVRVVTLCCDLIEVSFEWRCLLLAHPCETLSRPVVHVHLRCTEQHKSAVRKQRREA